MIRDDRPRPGIQTQEIRYFGDPCPGGEFLPEDALVIETAKDADEWLQVVEVAQVEFPLMCKDLLSAAVPVLEALAASRVGKPA